MYVAASAPRHTLHQRVTEVIKRYSDLHPRVQHVAIIMAQQHHLVVMREIIIGDGYPCGPHYRVDQAVRAVR